MFNPGLAIWLLTLLEAVLVVATVAFAWMRSRRHPPALPARLASGFVALARRKTLSVVVVGLLSLTWRAALLPLLGIPEPRWNDEFSYLLAGKTFASGRVTNPSPPLWVHFETFHVIMQPTYMSMYAPGQGLILALGQGIAHRPWVGVLLITAIMCSTLTWMLQGWMPPTWALFGGLLAVLRLGVLSYWMNSYWCPALAAAGGALVLGALPRIKRAPSASAAVALAIGLIVLANSRPYEGFVLSLAIAGFLLAWLFSSKRPSFSVVARRLVVPLVLVLGAGALATGYYYWRVTGSPLRMPYKVDRDTYAVVPYFIFFSPRPIPTYHHPVIRNYYAGWEVGEFQQARSFLGFLRRNRHKALDLWRFYIGPALTIPLFVLPWTVRDRRMRFPLIASAVFILALLVQTWTFPHYTAPATGLVYILVVQCFRHLSLWRRRALQTGRALVHAAVLAGVGMWVLRLTAVVTHTPIEPPWPRGNLDRSRIVAQLTQLPRPQLVLVRYGPHHNADLDWIYNEPDIPNAKLMWAHDMGSQNGELFEHFPDRQVWLLDVDDSTPQLSPYLSPAPGDQTCDCGSQRQAADPGFGPQASHGTY
jgi:hypothetical protein